jgi:16S rRNA (guanine(527)-N(7))-methyltransferase RsmG
MACTKEMQRLLDQFSILPGSDKGLKLAAYHALLQKWNARIDLTASSDWRVLGPLFEEAIWASAFYPAHLSKHLDIGSGAGFPAIPIRIMTTHIKLELVESREKRVIFLENVARELDLNSTQVHQERLDKFLGKGNDQWDSFSWKAVKLKTRELMDLLSFAHQKTLFWMFHGKKLPVEDESAVKEGLEIVRQEKCPCQDEWKLSIYKKKNTADVSRETIA